MQLRARVAIHEDGDTSTVCDEQTGLRLVVSRELGAWLRTLGEQTAPDNDNHQVLSFFEQLGLLGELDGEQARRRQALFILADAEHCEHARVVATVERARQQTALHREHLQTLPSGDWALSSLPILGKEALRRHFPRGLTVDSLDLGGALRRGDLTVTSTSGSTGERLQVYSDTRVPRLPADFASLWGLQTLPSDRPLRTAVLTSPGCSGGVCTRQLSSMTDRISFEHTLFLESARDPFELTAAQVHTILDELTTFAPDLLVVNPVYLQLFTARADKLAITLPRLTMQAIVTTYQFCPPSLSRSFAESYGVPVFQLYSATELGGSQVGISCRHGALHVRLDHLFLELVEGDTRVEPGALGNPVVTTHHPSMPLVRYRLTDLARFALEPCACEVGSAWPRLILEGRERDAFVRPSGRVTTAAVDALLADEPVSMYQLSEPRPGHFRLAVVTETDSPSTTLHTRLSTLLQTEQLEIVCVSRLPLEDNGKFRYTIPYREPEHG